ncbi:MAG: class I SAM-dependent methyltransferase, partial [Phaeodactylibacter sp.]|nr:class I SAM-dependent methyltransferase [Phaeodactylibacter sp.]
YLKADTLYNLHSPFVYTFAKEVLEDRRFFYCFAEVETLRQQLLRNFQTIEITDLGAGSRVNQSNERQIRDLARYSVSRPVFCRWLFRMVQLYQPTTILELGTSLGISTLYLSAAARQAKLITLEGAPSIFALAQQHFAQFDYGQIDARLGPFEEQLPSALLDLDRLDFAYIDGNHTYEATLHYFEQCLDHSHDRTLLVFDDIHWSVEMEKAWAEIRRHPKVRLSIDLYQAGVVSFNPDFLEKQEFLLVPYRWKPWKFGWI